MPTRSAPTGTAIITITAATITAATFHAPPPAGACGAACNDISRWSLPKQLRETKVVKDKSADEIARELVEWIKQ